VADALKGMESGRGADAFDGEDLPAGGLGGEGVAGIERDAVDENGAGATAGAIATAVGAGHTELHSDDFPERGAGFIFGDAGLAVDDEGGFFGGDGLGQSYGASEKGGIAGDSGERYSGCRGFQKITT
jgi:hypothetical protein